jgi:hypothetical protein
MSATSVSTLPDNNIGGAGGKSSTSPQNMYNNMSSTVFGNQQLDFGNGGGDALQTGQQGLQSTLTPNNLIPISQQSSIPTGSQLPTRTENVPAQIPDYSSIVQNMHQYIDSMNQLLSQMNQR